MANLTGKFDALKTFLTALFEPVTTPLDEINTKLDALAEVNRKLGAVPAGTTGIYEYIVGIEAWLSIIQPDIVIAKQYLNTIRVAGQSIDTRDALRYTIEQQVATAIGASSGAGLAPLTTTQRNIADLLAILNANLGSTTGTTPGTAIALLRTLPDILACVCGGNAPQLDGPDGCTSPFISSASVIGDAAEGELAPPTYATFPGTLPASISFGSTDLLAPSQAELVVNYTNDWRYYVESDAPSHTTSRNSMALKPNNQWITLVGTLTNIAWMVEQPYTLKVYICPPATALPTICSDFTANLDIRGFWGYRIAGYPGNWSVQANDNWYAENDFGITLDGPYSANQVYSISSLPALPFRMRFGTTVNLTAPTGQICPPA